MSEIDNLVEYVVDQYLRSARRGSYNGVSAFSALLDGPIKSDFKATLALAVESEALECVWDINPHIKRFWAGPPSKQLENLIDAKPDAFRIYPTQKQLKKVVPASEMQDKPFSRRLLLGEPQLEFATFELQTLSRYLYDPRYLLNFEDYAGSIGISNQHYESIETLERDRVGLQSFGLAIDGNQIPHVVVFLRYLDRLSPEHQQYWRSFEAARVPMCWQYFQSSILGEFWENRSIRNAIKCEISIINAMARVNFGKLFFKNELSKEMPVDISAFSVPSIDNFGRMALAWDKALSDNIDVNFFPSEIKRSNSTINKIGETLVERRGSISLLNEWIRDHSFHTDRSEISEEIVRMFKEVRELRQGPAHRFSRNQFSKDFYRQRRALLVQIFEGLRSLRIVFSAFPMSNSVEVPDWLNSDDIEVF